MGPEITSELASQLTRLTELSNRAYETVSNLEAAGGNRVDLQTPIPSVGHSIAHAHARIQALITLVSGITSADSTKFLLVPTTHLAGLAQELQRLADTFAQFLASVAVVNEQQGGFGALDATGFVVTSQSGQSAINLGDHYSNVETQSDAALDRAHRVVAIMRPESYEPFAAAVMNLETVLGTLAATRAQAAHHLKEIEGATAAASECSASAAREAAETATARQAADEALAKARDDHVVLVALLQKIDETRARAESLNQQVDAYQQKFADFDAKLSERNTQIQSGNTELDRLLSYFEGLNGTATSMISNAKEALQWGTAEGLSASFATSAMELDEPLRRTIRFFICSIFLLTAWVFAVFILAPKLDPSLSLFNVPPSLNALSTAAFLLGAIAIRITVIAPALFLVLFFSNRYKMLFAARELYIFKKTVAASIPGFRETAASKDADEHVKAMTAAAYERLLFNPREQATRDLASEHRGGLLSRWLVALIKRALEESRKMSGS